MVDGTQYVSIAVGWDGAPPALWVRFTDDIHPGTIFTFALDAKETFAGFSKAKPKGLINLRVETSEDQLANGQRLYRINCLGCHGPMGANGGSIPNLAYSDEGIFGIMEDIVLKGMFVTKGMPNFSGRLNREEIGDIKNYILHSANEMREGK
jgi:quinohemoprotein ethanol dehydrogenase